MIKKLVWTVLPHRAGFGAVDPASGARPLELDLSIFVSPRLTPDGAVGELAEFDWGGGDNYTSWAAQPNVTFDFGGSQLVGTLTSAPDPTLWPVLFGPTTPVRNFAYKAMSNLKLLSFPVASIDRALGDAYGELASTNPTEFPGVQAGLPAGLQTLFTALPRIQQVFGRALTGRDTVTTPDNDPRELIAADDDVAIAQILGLNPGSQEAEVGVAFYKAYGFDHRTNRFAEQHDPNLAPAPRPAIPDFDFHEMLAALGDYPYLLRQLGLVLDYRVSMLRPAIPAASTVRLVTPPAPDTLTEQVTPHQLPVRRGHALLPGQAGSR